MPLHTISWGPILRGTVDASYKHYLVNKADEVAELPHWLWLLIEGEYEPSMCWGPYLFYNTFESTTEAQYLIEMFKYRILTATAETKVRNILKQYEPLIHINEKFVAALIEREGCPDYWRKPGEKPTVVGNETYQKIQERFENGNKN